VTSPHHGNIGDRGPGRLRARQNAVHDNKQQFILEEFAQFFDGAGASRQKKSQEEAVPRFQLR
jgi:hypothetical protein